jgi:hypothetical protein
VFIFGFCQRELWVYLYDGSWVADLLDQDGRSSRIVATFRSPIVRARTGLHVHPVCRYVNEADCREGRQWWRCLAGKSQTSRSCWRGSECRHGAEPADWRGWEGERGARPWGRWKRSRKFGLVAAERSAGGVVASPARQNVAAAPQSTVAALGWPSTPPCSPQPGAPVLAQPTFSHQSPACVEAVGLVGKRD